MSLVAVFSDSSATHLISDTLVTHPSDIDLEITKDEWLSTGIRLEKGNKNLLNHSEGILKVGLIQPNLALGFVGDVSLATATLQLIYEWCKIDPINSYCDFEKLIQQQILSAISPVKGSCCCCGFMEDDGAIKKFKFSLSETSGLTIESSSKSDEYYAIGSGRQEFINIWKRLPKEDLEVGIEPTLMFSLISEHLYAKQFVGETDLITKLHVGGAITGLYLHEGQILWQPPKTVIVFSNVGKVGFDADFKWLPIIYKTWSEYNNVFSSSVFEQNGSRFQRITQYSNPTSTPFAFSDTTLTDEMKTFNSQETFVLLLPKGLTSQHLSVIRAAGQEKAFEEIYENNRLAQIRLNDDFLKKITDYFFVAEDYTIKIGLDRFPHLIKALKKNLLMLSKDKEPEEWIRRQGEVAVRLMEYGGNKNDTNLLSEALDKFLDAYETARLFKSKLIVDTKFNLEQFLRDLRQNLNPHQLSAVLSNNQDALNRCRDEIDFGS